MSDKNSFNQFEQSLLRSWRHANWLTLVLLPLSGLYLILATLNRYWYLYGLGQRYTSPVPTIVVGNLTVGGTGKSPFVAALVKALQAQNLQVGIVSRGYKRTANAALLIDHQSDALTVGDEPLMLFLQTGAPTAVGADRRLAIKCLLATHQVDVIVCDDGLQHWKLKPSFTVCIDDQSMMTNNYWLLPAGPYRELRSRLKAMDEVVAHVSKPIPEALEPSGTTIKSNASQSNVSNSCFWLEAQTVQSVNKAEIHGSLLPTKVNLVAGIAKPQRFFETAQTLGYSGVQHSFSDHHQFSLSDLVFANGLPVLMTEKDAVKCRDFALDDLWYLPVSAQLDAAMVTRIVNRLGLTKNKL